MQKYKHLFFDLDHTLWDFETNSIHTLKELYEKYKLSDSFQGFDAFYKRYEAHNEELWVQYREGKITKELLNFNRFHTPLSEAGISDDAIAQSFAHDYITVSPTKTALMPHAKEVLDQLKQRHTLHVITNGFKEVQFIKLKNSHLHHYFSKVFISETIGASKPKTAFFEYAVKSANARKKECLIIGDNLETDIDGAINFGLDYIFFNPNKNEHKRQLMNEITDLRQIINIVKS
ncbi:YjjG family noncanonical pyrimidine nucleotidase [Saccharicrinis fermentans]|uniref:Pyrimidine 5'-nucleotidase YjjG n=1 Tax=Saccharicrinis fermentans DSM 9555 = JCM 21142 TaxID=869213 RepID=W7YJ37_9BACT|nr:YjjG family noncanonical pyrimidine nucleotidase [Saccharicrinis fermentans]GAF02554.1 pyrimidine 5'-nucleotidase YjjG [Saccharicrinis fermentans DSM 9555 = JCM 21142]